MQPASGVAGGNPETQENVALDVPEACKTTEEERRERIGALEREGVFDADATYPRPLNMLVRKLYLDVGLARRQTTVLEVLLVISKDEFHWLREEAQQVV